MLKQRNCIGARRNGAGLLPTRVSCGSYNCYRLPLLWKRLIDIIIFLPSSPTLAASSSVDVAVGAAVNKNFTHVFVKHRPAVSLPCPVSSCREQVLPSMWKIHMYRHASGALPGKIPQEWLSLNQYSVCSNFSTPVAISHAHAHISHCSGNSSSISDRHAATTKYSRCK